MKFFERIKSFFCKKDVVDESTIKNGSEHDGLNSKCDESDENYVPDILNDIWKYLLIPGIYNNKINHLYEREVEPFLKIPLGSKKQKEKMDHVKHIIASECNSIDSINYIDSVIDCEFIKNKCDSFRTEKIHFPSNILDSVGENKYIKIIMDNFLNDDQKEICKLYKISTFSYFMYMVEELFSKKLTCKASEEKKVNVKVKVKVSKEKKKKISKSKLKTRK